MAAFRLSACSNTKKRQDDDVTEKHGEHETDEAPMLCFRAASAGSPESSDSKATAVKKRLPAMAKPRCVKLLPLLTMFEASSVSCSPCFSVTSSSCRFLVFEHADKRTPPFFTFQTRHDRVTQCGSLAGAVHDAAGEP